VTLRAKLISKTWQSPNLASRVLTLNLQRLSQDWERYYGHPIPLVETLVDAARLRGTCYLASGWQMPDPTRGFAKRGSCYAAHGQPKGVFVRPLPAQASEGLGAALLPPSGTVLNLCSQFPFSSLEIRHFEPHSSLCLGVFVLKNQFVFGPENR
jgi:hypothetical protein